MMMQVDHDLRKDWDENARDLVVLDSDYRSNCKLIHWIMKYPVSTSCTVLEGGEGGEVFIYILFLLFSLHF